MRAGGAWVPYGRVARAPGFFLPSTAGVTLTGRSGATSIRVDDRDARIRTGGLLLPKQAR